MADTSSNDNRLNRIVWLPHAEAICYLRTPEHRKRKAELISQWKPWEQSTGPKTEEGKVTSSRNSTKHGMRSREMQKQMLWLRDFLQNCQEISG